MAMPTTANPVDTQDVTADMQDLLVSGLLTGIPSGLVDVAVDVAATVADNMAMATAIGTGSPLDGNHAELGDFTADDAVAAVKAIDALGDVTAGDVVAAVTAIDSLSRQMAALLSQQLRDARQPTIHMSQQLRDELQPAVTIEPTSGAPTTVQQALTMSVQMGRFTVTCDDVDLKVVRSRAGSFAGAAVPAWPFTAAADFQSGMASSVPSVNLSAYHRYDNLPTLDIIQAGGEAGVVDFKLEHHTVLAREAARGYYIAYIWLFADELDASTLKVALGETLTKYPILAGRIVPSSNGRTVAAANQGARFRTQSMAGSSHQVDPLRCHPELLCLPERQSVLDGVAPLCSATLTHFGDGSTAVGIGIFHSVCDGSSLHRFMVDWSAAARGAVVSPKVCPRPTFSRAPFECTPEPQNNGAGSSSTVPNEMWAPTAAEAAALAAAKAATEEMEDMLVIEYTADDLTRLRVEAEKTSTTWISRHEAMSAHILALLSKVWVETGVGDPNLHLDLRINISSTINGRGRKDTGIDGGFFGNCAIYSQGSSVSLGDCLFQPLGKIAQTWHDDLLRYSGPAVMQQLELCEVAGKLGKAATYLGNPLLPTLICNNRSKFPAYEVDFGFGRPVDVIPHFGQAGIKIYAAPNDGCRVYFKGSRNAFTVLREGLKEAEGYSDSRRWGGDGGFWFQSPPVDVLRRPEWLSLFHKFEDTSAAVVNDSTGGDSGFSSVNNSPSCR